MPVLTSENDNKSITFKFPKSYLMNITACLNQDPNKTHTSHLIMSLKSLVIYRVPSPFFIFYFVTY